MEGTYVNSKDNKLVLKVLKSEFFLISGFYGSVIIKDKQIELADKGFGTAVGTISRNQLIFEGKEPNDLAKNIVGTWEKE